MLYIENSIKSIWVKSRNDYSHSIFIWFYLREFSFGFQIHFFFIYSFCLFDFDIFILSFYIYFFTLSKILTNVILAILVKGINDAIIQTVLINAKVSWHVLVAILRMMKELNALVWFLGTKKKRDKIFYIFDCTLICLFPFFSKKQCNICSSYFFFLFFLLVIM